jgi:hypothetical protein
VAGQPPWREKPKRSRGEDGGGGTATKAEEKIAVAGTPPWREKQSPGEDGNGGTATKAEEKIAVTGKSRLPTKEESVSYAWLAEAQEHLDSRVQRAANDEERAEAVAKQREFRQLEEQYIVKMKEAWKRVHDLDATKAKLGAMVGLTVQEQASVAPANSAEDHSQTPRGRATAVAKDDRTCIEDEQEERKRKPSKSKSMERSKRRIDSASGGGAEMVQSNCAPSSAEARKIARPSFAEVRASLQRVQGDGLSKNRLRLLINKGLPLDSPFEELCVQYLKTGMCAHKKCQYMHWCRTEVSDWCTVQGLLGWRQAWALHTSSMETVDDVACYFRSQQEAEALI